MKTIEDVEALEKLIGQLQGLHSEISVLAKKAPNDAVNPFKLGLVNRVIATANDVLGPTHLPFAGFSGFDDDQVATTSDVTLVLSQYMQEAERFRSDSIAWLSNVCEWRYVVDGHVSKLQSGPPSKVGRK